ncbi:MAG TPA: cyclophilin-like fold protein [Smithellaceae bacterium]|nr:cyclophilin-like fold protein [Smithellaceae bacterium]HRS90350.1 cyclophilin-like fold protein [Smithellaceae bacterium]HRV27084.1 cyclophilin-like fold protein [Smithellaceae bacterium]
MSTAVKIVVGKTILSGKLFDTLCAQAIIKSLPIKARPNRWGDEFYFEIPVDMPSDNTATKKVKIGDIGYWPPGKALAIFFGPTPMSTCSDPVPAGEVNIVGEILDDASVLRHEKDADNIRIESA